MENRNALLLILILALAPWVLSGVAPLEPRPGATASVIPLQPHIIQYLIRECSWSGVPLEIGMGLTVMESSGKPTASHRNRNGTIDRGLLQHNSRFHQFLVDTYNSGREFNPYNARDNLRVGLSYLADLYKQTGTWKQAIIAFNCGPTRAAAGRPPKSSVTLARIVTKGLFFP